MRRGRRKWLRVRRPRPLARLKRDIAAKLVALALITAIAAGAVMAIALKFLGE